jgi:hypothetical protein
MTSADIATPEDSGKIIEPAIQAFREAESDGLSPESCLKAALDGIEAQLQQMQTAVVSEASEEMCAEARGFIMGLDLGYRKWDAMKTHLAMGGYLRGCRRPPRSSP